MKYVPYIEAVATINITVFEFVDLKCIDCKDTQWSIRYRMKRMSNNAANSTAFPKREYMFANYEKAI